MTKPIRHTSLLALTTLALIVCDEAFAQQRIRTQFSDGNVPPAIIARPAEMLRQPNLLAPPTPMNGGSQRCRADYTLRFCVLATRNLTLDGNINTDSIGSPGSRSLRSNKCLLGCYGKADVSRGRIEHVYSEPDGFKWTTGDIGFSSGSTQYTAPHPALPLLPVLRPSPSKRLVANPQVSGGFSDVIQPAPNEIYDISLIAKKLSRGHRVDLNLGAGDYISGGLNVSSIRVQPNQKVRLFLTDNANVDGYAFVSGVNGRVGVESFRDGKAVNFQIWYNGQGTIKLDHNTTFCGIIYAPNARVEMGEGNCSFEGAVIARDINCEGNIHFTYDEDLARVALDK
jgi:hypothetical protein